MKKITLITAILLMSFTLFAVNFNLTCGLKNEIVKGHVHDPLFITVNAWQNFGNLKVFGSYTNESSKKREVLMFCPPQDYIITGMSYDFYKIKIIIEYKTGGYTKIEIQIGKED